MWAGFSDHARTVAERLASGANPNLLELYGDLPLHAAAATGAVVGVKLPLPANNDREDRDCAGKTTRDLVAAGGHQDVVGPLEARQVATAPDTNLRVAPLGR